MCMFFRLTSMFVQCNTVTVVFLMVANPNVSKTKFLLLSPSIFRERLTVWLSLQAEFFPTYPHFSISSFVLFRPLLNFSSGWKMHYLHDKSSCGSLQECLYREKHPHPPLHCMVSLSQSVALCKTAGIKDTSPEVCSDIFSKNKATVLSFEVISNCFRLRPDILYSNTTIMHHCIVPSYYNLKKLCKQEEYTRWSGFNE